METVCFGNAILNKMMGRSCADQLFGNQNRHFEVRKNAIAYIKSHKDEYAPFMDETSESFNKVHFALITVSSSSMLRGCLAMVCGEVKWS